MKEGKHEGRQAGWHAGRNEDVSSKIQGPKHGNSGSGRKTERDFKNIGIEKDGVTDT